MRNYSKNTLTKYGTELQNRCKKSQSQYASDILDSLRQLKLGYYTIVPSNFDKYILPLIKSFNEEIDDYDFNDNGSYKFTLLIPSNASTRQRNLAMAILNGEEAKEDKEDYTR